MFFNTFNFLTLSVALNHKAIYFQLKTKMSKNALYTAVCGFFKPFNFIIHLGTVVVANITQTGVNAFVLIHK